MTYEEFIEKYGNEKVKFKSYYKYIFNFTNNKGIIVSMGGISDDIYRCEIQADKEYLISELGITSAYSENEELWIWKGW